MPLLESQTATGETRDATFEVEGRQVTVEGSASEAECAALACAVASHLQDEARARARDSEEDGDRYAVPVWKLGRRLGARRRGSLPRECPAGSEWKAAGRTSPW